jgi:hypothetical protein
MRTRHFARKHARTRDQAREHIIAISRAFPRSSARVIANLRAHVRANLRATSCAFPGCSVRHAAGAGTTESRGTMRILWLASTSIAQDGDGHRSRGVA